MLQKRTSLSVRLSTAPFLIRAGVALRLVDVLGDVLELARVRGTLLATFDARAPWGIELPARPGAAFHAVVAGTCWFGVGGDPPRRLLPGDLVLLPGGVAHQLAAEPGLPLRRFDEALKRELITEDGDLVLDGPGPRTRVICAGYRYDGEVAQPLLGLLPPVLHVSATAEHGAGLRALLDLLAHECRSAADTGASTAAARLLDVLLVHVVRIWLDGPDPDRASWLRGLRDPVTARALGLMHEQPGRPWTLQHLADAAHVSRATLARRFAEHVGESPLGYLTRWRMDVAARRLRDTDLPAATVAREVGYTSEYAFNRAFARYRCRPPGRYRRDVAATPG
jgi:AraC-like DNA-binding protein